MLGTGLTQLGANPNYESTDEPEHDSPTDGLDWNPILEPSRAGNIGDRDDSVAG